MALVTSKKQAKQSESLLSIISNPAKILFPGAGVTKIALAKYYQAVAEWMLPYVINRPLTLLRCPTGYQQACFYQKHFPKALPKNLWPINIKESKKEETYFYVKDISGIIELVQLSVLEIHPWECCVDNVEKPDVIIFDLDPGEDVAWERVIRAAHYIRDCLTDLSLQSFVKTTGGKGLHVVIPIKRLYSWEEIKSFTKGFVDVLAEKHPDEFVNNMSKAKRVGKIYLDYLRNQRGATAIAPYSSRARDLAPVAYPLSWQSLTAKVNPAQFTVATVPGLLAKLKKDPWEGYFDIKTKQKIILPTV